MVSNVFLLHLFIMWKGTFYGLAVEVRGKYEGANLVLQPNGSEEKNFKSSILLADAFTFWAMFGPLKIWKFSLLYLILLL